MFGITTIIASANFSDLGKTDAKKIINQIKEEKANRIMAAPGFLDVIVDYCIKNNLKLDCVEKIFTGGGAVFVDFIRRLKKVFSCAKIVTIYGSTEAEPIAELDVEDMSIEDMDKIENGYGILAGNICGVTDCKIIKTGINEIGDLSKKEFENLYTEVGEIVVSGRNVLDGYLNGVGDKENKFSVEGIKYHRTGDLGFFDEDGRLWLRGRVKEPYFNIEAVLHAKFNVGKTAVFKYDDKIILVLEKDCLINEREIKNAINFQKISEIKYVNKIPVDKRHSTKVNYNELKKILKLD